MSPHSGPMFPRISYIAALSIKLSNGNRQAGFVAQETHNLRDFVVSVLSSALICS